MGNQIATTVGDSLTCMRTHQNQNATISREVAGGDGNDLDEAVLAATNLNISQGIHLSQTLQLSFACKKLPNMDTFTRTDGMAVLFEQKGNMWSQVGMTEVVMDNLNPQWVKCFDVQYKFEEKQIFKVVVYDIEDPNSNLSKFDNHSLVGELEFTLHELVTVKDQLLIKQFTNKQDATIEISAEEHSQDGQSKDIVTIEPVLQFKGSKESGSILFLIVYKVYRESKLPGGQHIWKPIYKSEIREQSNGQFVFNAFHLMKHDMNSSDDEKEIKIEIFRSNKNGKHQNIGNVLFTMDEIKGDLDKANFKLPIIRQSNSFMSFNKFEIKNRTTFLDYIFGGCEINLAIAIDFTISNRNPTDPDSLHQSNLNRNQYYQALKSVGDILQFYDADKQFPSFGYGAKLNMGVGDNQASHCFALNGNIFDPECDGLDGVLEAYKRTVQKAEFYGPTQFAPVVEMANNMAEALQVSQANQKYLILLIITDGQIMDMEQTIDQIVRGSTNPLSIIIVGVGNADFSSMDTLDADDQPLYSQRFRKYMESDIVQFVPFSQFKNDPKKLAKKTLEEVPRQFMDYMKKNNILPTHTFEQEKIKNQLTRKNAVKTENINQECGDEFFVTLQDQCINNVLKLCRGRYQKYSYEEIKKFLQERGFPENNPSQILKCLDNQNQYKNRLMK